MTGAELEIRCIRHANRTAIGVSAAKFRDTYGKNSRSRGKPAIGSLRTLQSIEYCGSVGDAPLAAQSEVSIDAAHHRVDRAVLRCGGNLHREEGAGRYSRRSLFGKRLGSSVTSMRG